MAVRYRAREPEYAEIYEGLAATWGPIVVALAIGVAGFALGTRFG